MSAKCLSAKWDLRALSEFEECRYHAYPHCNGFADGGKSIVLGAFDQGFENVSLWKMGLDGQGQRRICIFPVYADPAHPSTAQLWFDVALETNTAAVVAGDEVWLYDLTAMDAGRMIYRAVAGETLNPLPSMRGDGSRLLIASTQGQMRGVSEVDLQSAEVRRVFEVPWYANHFHYSPHSPRWIAFCHEGDARIIRDRMWASHAEHAPGGECIFRQGKSLMVGHERACFHRASIATIAFGAAGLPTGLYEAELDGSHTRLVSGGSRDWHCDVSRDGEWAVLDTTGPYDRDGYGWENAEDCSDIVLVDMATGKREPLARSHQAVHPWHPHPVFSPDGKRIVFGEFAGTKDNPRGRVWMLCFRG